MTIKQLTITIVGLCAIVWTFGLPSWFLDVYLFLIGWTLLIGGVLSAVGTIVTTVTRRKISHRPPITIPIGELGPVVDVDDVDVVEVA